MAADPAHVRPEYPPLMRQGRVQGKVILEAVIEKDGRVTDVRIVESPHQHKSTKRW